ncbi:MAG: deoxyribonuclease IV [bacterium]|nr:deoxyribonuclease IV [bacterium]
MLFGAHVSIAGGVLNAPKNAADLGCEIFQMFTRSPQGGHVPLLDKKIGDEFKKLCLEYNQKEWVVHAPYIINFASDNPRTYHGSISIIRQELGRSSLLGASYLMAHLGSYKNLGKDAGLVQVVAGLKEVLTGYSGSTEFLIEISAGAGEIIGGTFDGIAEIIHHKDLKNFKIGVCYDTQHGFASGYDSRAVKDVENTLKKFDMTIGLDRLKMSHCNDSETEYNSHKDRHEHIGQGKIGLAGFKAILTNKNFRKINFILETDHNLVREDLKIVKNIRDSK